MFFCLIHLFFPFGHVQEIDPLVQDIKFKKLSRKKFGIMNSNNWLSFPLSPTHSSLPPHLQTAQSHHFSLGLVNETIDNPFQNQGTNILFLTNSSLFCMLECATISLVLIVYIFAEWNLMNTQGSNEVPKVADFLGMNKSENQSELIPYNEIQANDSDYLFQNNHLMPSVQNALGSAPTSNYDLQENACNIQSLTLSMGSGKGSTSETSASPSATAATASASAENSNNTSIVEAAPRRTLDTFGQRTSIYRGVTR